MVRSVKGPGSINGPTLAIVFMKKEGDKPKKPIPRIEPLGMSRSEAIKSLFKDVEEILRTGNCSLSQINLATKARQTWRVLYKGEPKQMSELDLRSYSGPLTGIFGGLVGLLRETHLTLERIAKHLGPEQWQALCTASSVTDMMEYISTSESTDPSKKRHEYGRRRSRHEVGEIEGQFGRAERENPALSVNPYQLKAAEPTCLDHVFADGKITMQEMEELFQIGRARFRTLLPAKVRSGRRKGDAGVYDYIQVLQIMRGLLADNPESKRPRPRGKPRKGWLQDRETRNRVFDNIERRLKAVQAPTRIATAFQKLISKNCSESGK